MSTYHLVIWLSCMTIGISGGATAALLFTSLVRP